MNISILRKGIVAIMIFLLICISSHSSIGNTIEKENSFPILEVKTLYVGGSGPNNFTKIQDAIDNSSDGDTIFVFNGTYYENIVIESSISLIGEDKNITTIDGKREESAINLASENTIIKNFTITGGGFDTDVFDNFFWAGIRATGSNNKICNNIFVKNRFGISGVRVTNLTIKDNIFIEDGIGFTSYENDGRPLAKLKYFTHKIENNTVNGKPLYYFINEQNKLINNLEIGQLVLVNCNNFKIKNVTISKTDEGLTFAFTNDCLIENCNFIENSIAIWTFKSNKNFFRLNNISNNHYRGIVIDQNSNSNKMKYNNIINEFCGVEIEWYSNNNLIYKNNFINNTISGFEHQSIFSRWFKNYYDDWIGAENPIFSFCPKIIRGMPIEKIPQIVIPVSIDFFPAKKPYDIMI